MEIIALNNMGIINFLSRDHCKEMTILFDIKCHVTKLDIINVI